MHSNHYQQQHYILALHHIPGIGPKTFLRFIQRWPQLEELFSLTIQQRIAAGIPANIADAIHRVNWPIIDADLAWQQANPNHHLFIWGDPNYPRILSEIYAPPPVLYAIGNCSALEQTTLGIVGTRKPSFAGRHTAQQFAAALAEHQLTIVSGLALGIDAAAHIGCVETQGKTIAVLGSGLHHIYPYQHRQLAEKIQENGLIISEFPLKSTPKAGHFPQRNRIISGLSVAILVVEAALKSGSLITAKYALEQNREIMAIPGAIQNTNAQGCHYLLQQGATLVTCVTDILEELSIRQVPKPANSQLMLAMNEENLLKCLGFEVTSLNQIMIRSGLNFEEVADQLATLELSHKIKAVPGGYMRCSI